MIYLLQTVAVLSAVTLAASSVVKPKNGTFELLILHNNDMHARFEQTSQLSGICTAADQAANKCYGGFARVATVVKEAREKAASGEGPPVLYLNAGDTYTGSAWFTIYKWKIAAEFINALQPDAVALGNNEIDKELNTIYPFLRELDAPVVSSNVLLKSAEDNAILHKSIVLDVDGNKVGVVGYLQLDKNALDSTGNVEYIDEIIALKEEVAVLQEHNINIIIALGHSDLEKDIEIAREVEGIDIVIGGAKNVYYWNGTCVSETADNAIVVNQPSGSQALVLQSHAYNKFLGGLHVEFDSSGEIKAFNDEAVSLDLSISRDPTVEQILNKFSKEISALSEEVVGTTAVTLDGSSCKTEECNLGNLITDAMMHYYAVRYEGDNWSDAPIAVIPSGMIAGSISPVSRPSDITMGDLLSVLPAESKVVAVTMDGAVFLQMLEHSISSYDISNPTGQLLQMSGIRLTYDLDREVGSRVVSAVVRCWSCDVPIHYVIDDWRTYKLLMPASLANGEYGYTMLTSLPKEELDYDEITCLKEFMELRRPVYPEISGRIEIINLPEAAEEDEDIEEVEDIDQDGNENEDLVDSENEEPNSAKYCSLSVAVIAVTMFTWLLN